MRSKRFINVLVSIALVFVLLACSPGGQQEDPLAEQLEIITYLGMQSVKASRPEISLQFAGIKSFEVNPNSPPGKSLVKFGISLKVEAISFLSPDEKGMTIRQPDKLVVPIPNEWRAPFTIKMHGAAQLPEVEFKGGEIVWDYGKSTVSIKKGTFARIKGIEYRFSSGRWNISALK